ncbi:ATP-binding protein [Methylomagnum ishizawai]|uniref:ATP-binding protein n=1 Tax=Methylomagnum ishizawai TaxID=1760988 RepID=UPI001C32CC26|nr:ATP-binding protein [Methylomagnum ishizawai]BBL77127.1 hypothetical protein MishRS11D_42250 [Methylomagnum ishizawai]
MPIVRPAKYPGQRIPLASWIWRSYAKTALVPLLLVEVALIGIYIQTNYWSRQANIDLLRQEATQSMRRISQQEADNVSRQLNSITQLTDLYRRQTALALATPARSGLENPERYQLDPNGVYHARGDDGGSAVYYSGIVPVGPKEMDKVRRSAALDPFMQQIKAVNPLVVQIYLNTHDSLNRIYPYMDFSQYPPKMNIPAYNFYYEADAIHDPERKPVWTDVYLDPAGKGWLASCIAPVYRGDFLEGVVGLDITVGTIIQRVLDLKLPWDMYGVMVGKDGSLLAMPKAGEEDFGLNELVNHQYQQAVGQDTFKPEEFNLYKRPQLRELANRIGGEPQGLAEARIGGERLAAWNRVGETGWTFMVVATPAKIFASAVSLSEQLEKIAFAMIETLVLFYLLFFVALFIRARIASRTIARPLKQIELMMLGIGQGRYEQAPLEFNVQELHETARELSAMGRELGAAHRDLMATQRQLQEHVRWLEAVFQLSPDGLVTFDREGRIGQGNPAFFAMTGFGPDQTEGWTLADFRRGIGQLTVNAGPPPFDADGAFPLELLRPCPRSLYCQVRVFGDDGDGAAPKALIAYFHDLTRETELDRMKSEFLATAAHELRTPLTVVAGYAELLSVCELEPAMQKDMAAAILEQSQRLIAIVGDLLDLSRLESRAGRDFNIVPQPLAPVVRAALHEAVALQGRSGGFGGAEALDGLDIPVDAAKFKLALVKVLDNARTYSPEDTPIAIGVRFREGAEGREVGVEVADQGMGMDAEQIGHVFERFYRADTSGKVPGSGLGMCIVKEIMDVHLGSVEINSEPGQGTRICLWLRMLAEA